MIFDGEFDAGDAALFGGIMGFIEESIKSEEFGEDEGVSAEQVDNYVENSSNFSLRLLYNENPELVKHLINRVYQERSRTATTITEEEIQAVHEEMLEELREQEKNGSE